MAGIQIRINQRTVDDLRELGKEFGETTDDVTIRLLIEKYRRSVSDIKLLKIETEEKSRLIKEMYTELKESVIETQHAKSEIKQLESRLLQWESDYQEGQLQRDDE